MPVGVAPALILMGFYMLWRHRLNLPSLGFSGGGSDRLKSKGPIGTLLLGVLFSFAFALPIEL